MSAYHDKATVELFVRHRTELERYAARLVGPFNAEDVVQEAFLKYARDPRRTELDSPIRYLAATVRNLAIDVLRREKREDRIFDTNYERCHVERIGSDADTPEISTQRASEYRSALRALHELPVKTRDAVMLHLVEECSLRTIATRLGVSLGTAHALVKAGTLHCRKRLSETKK